MHAHTRRTLCLTMKVKSINHGILKIWYCYKKINMITQKHSNVYIQCERHLCHLFSIYIHEGAYIYSLLYLSEGTEFIKNCRIKNKLKAWMPKWWNKQCCKLLRTAVEVVTKTDSRTSRILLSAFPPFLLFCLLLWNGITVQQRLILWPLCVIKVLPLLVIDLTKNSQKMKIWIKT